MLQTTSIARPFWSTVELAPSRRICQAGTCEMVHKSISRLHGCHVGRAWHVSDRIYVCQISHQTVLCDVVSRDVTDRCYSSILLALKRRPILRHRCSNFSSLRSWSTVSPLSVLPVPDTPGMLTHSNSSYIGAVASFSGR